MMITIHMRARFLSGRLEHRHRGSTWARPIARWLDHVIFRMLAEVHCLLNNNDNNIHEN